MHEVNTHQMSENTIFSWAIAYEKLVEALTQHSLLKGIKQASPVAQTSCLEGYHSVVNQFAPKMLGYSYLGCCAGE